MKKTIFCLTCVLALAACQSAPKKDAKATPKDEIEITGEATTTMSREPIVPTDPSVSVYDTEGPLVNPLLENRARGVLDNTTAGGYTVFDESVTVYPLPGEQVPAYMPNYTVPPLMGQTRPPAPMVGQPVGLAASASTLPPVPTVDVATADPYAKPPVSGAVRQPMMLTAVEPVGMQPPAQARAPMLSPFGADDDMMADAPTPPVGPVSLTSPGAPGASTPATGAPATGTPSMSEGRRSSPLLTGY